ncbi:hypothetical protein KKG41_03185 [Patescibacteria group bacterium]|nr:hypothetical protein [Patescibacteria group bacterium]
MDLKKTLENLASKKKVKIGIGLHTPTPSIVKSLKKASSFCDIVVIGKKVPNFKHIAATRKNMEEVTLKEVINKKVDALIRGQSDAFLFEDYLARLGGYDRKGLLVFELFIDQFDRSFFTTSGSHPDGWTIRSKKMQVDELIKVVQSFGLKPKIGFRTWVRPGSVGRNFFFDQTWEQAEYLVEDYKKQGFRAKNYNIEIETAVADGCNIVVFATGAGGNIFSRALLFFTKNPFVVYFHGGIKEVIIQNNRTLQDYYNNFLLGAAMVNSKRKKK